MQVVKLIAGHLINAKLFQDISCANSEIAKHLSSTLYFAYVGTLLLTDFMLKRIKKRKSCLWKYMMSQKKT